MARAQLVRIGSGAGFQGDRIDAAVILAAQGRLHYLGLECLAERTIALAQLARLDGSGPGYDPLLDSRMRALLPICKRHRTCIVTNLGAANPAAAGARVIELAKELGLKLRVSVVLGDDVLDRLTPQMPVMENEGRLGDYGQLLSANAYLGADAILPAFAGGTDVVITGRVADPSLFLAPMMREFGWSPDDADRLARGTVLGHLLECAGQVTGGYFADPGRKDVRDLANLGFPYVEVEASGAAVLTKVPGTGGEVSLRTVREQLLYEVTNPGAYVTPDVVADFSRVQLTDLGHDRVRVAGATGRPRPPAVKVSVGYHAGYLGEAEISYAGANARARAELAGEIVRERLREAIAELRVDLIGINAVHRTDFGCRHDPYEVRLRVAGSAPTRELAERIGHEVEALYTNGPAGGAGVRRRVADRIGIVSTLLARDELRTSVVPLSTEHAAKTA